MSDRPLKIGDRVRLRSGGELMTVHSIAGTIAWLRWHNRNGDMCEKSDVKSETLMLVEGVSDHTPLQGR